MIFSYTINLKYWKRHLCFFFLNLHKFILEDFMFYFASKLFPKGNIFSYMVATDHHIYIGGYRFSYWGTPFKQLKDRELQMLVLQDLVHPALDRAHPDSLEVPTVGSVRQNFFWILHCLQLPGMRSTKVWLDNPIQNAETYSILLYNS